VVHEITHVAGYVHVGQRRDGNECTVPHLLGDIAEWSAWEKTQPARPYETNQTVCAAFVCASQAEPKNCRVLPEHGAAAGDPGERL
jgi:hypothetical protein